MMINFILQYVMYVLLGGLFVYANVFAFFYITGFINIFVKNKANVRHDAFEFLGLFLLVCFVVVLVVFLISWLLSKGYL